ncbi:hypothetical protein [Schlesneria sp.]|uniref:hypothetical protein n=1 Tax=Schlesneria sp. TaxID=2762018 RepID=UPI002EEA5CCE
MANSIMLLQCDVGVSNSSGTMAFASASVWLAGWLATLGRASITGDFGRSGGLFQAGTHAKV